MIYLATDAPVIAPAPASQAPPSGDPELIASYYVGPDGGQSNTAPIIQWQGYTYWVYGTRRNDWTMHILAFDASGTMRKRIDLGDPARMTGARYLWLITVEAEQQTVTLWGQARKTLTCTWDQLVVGS